MANEVRLIDANALMKAIKSFRWISVPGTLKLLFDYLQVIIKNQPTVDAVEVVHGRWQERRFICMDSEVMLGYRCSECNLTFDVETNYCPNCGAKMDGDGNANP